MTDEIATIGHNSQAGKAVAEFVRQIEQTEREKQGVQADIKELYAAAKEAGFSVPALRRAVKWKLMSPGKREEAQKLEDTAQQYLHALGILD